jgi:hypothetical protein
VRAGAITAGIVQFVAATGCSFDLEDEIGSVQAEVEVPLGANQAVPADNQWHNLAGLSFPMSQGFVGPGESLYLYATARTDSQNDLLRLDKLRIECFDDENPGSAQYTQTMHNHPGPGTELNKARLLLTSPNARAYRCSLLALSKLNAGNQIYQAGSSNTQLTYLVFGPGGARWGTENDTVESFVGEQCCDSAECQTYNGSCCGTGSVNCTYLGPGTEEGVAAWVLQSPRFSIPAQASSISVYSDLQLTTCYEDSSSCIDSVDSGSGTTTVDLRLRVQQMASSTSNTPCKTTTYPSPTTFDRRTITQDEHHKKINLALTFIGFDDVNCTGRSFKVQTNVQHVSGPPFLVDYGDGGRRGFSTSFAIVYY